MSTLIRLEPNAGGAAATIDSNGLIYLGAQPRMPPIPDQQSRIRHDEKS